MTMNKKTIFLVDDDVTNLTTGKNALAETYNVFTINSGARLLKMLEKTIPDLILLDVEMPEMNGYEVIKAVKKNEETAHIPIIFLTGKSDGESELEGLSLGAIDYITKPFSPPLLKKRLEVHLLVEEQKRELRRFNDNLQETVEAKTKTVLELTEKARLTESLLALQREQYARIARNVEETRALRHDMRHQIAVIKGYLNGVFKYCDEIAGNIPLNIEQIFCDNFAVNAVVHHYSTLAESAGITADIRLDIPEKAGGVSDMDLCVIVGNLFENAVEACRRLEGGERFIRVKSAVKGNYLSLVVENSFDGLWQEENGAYFSRKHDKETRREGVGLASVKAVCSKYDGLAKFEADGKVWSASALVDMTDKGG